MDLESLSTEELQGLLAAVVKEYAHRREDDLELAPFPVSDSDVEVSASAGLICVSAILEAIGVELFEVALWRSWGRG